MLKAPLWIPVPKSVDELLQLGNLIYTQHKKDEQTSPLATLKDYDWSVEGSNQVLATQKHQLAEDLVRQAEKTYRERVKLMGDIKDIITVSRDLLKGAYKKIPKKLGDWGVAVHDIPKLKKNDDDNKEKKVKDDQ